MRTASTAALQTAEDGAGTSDACVGQEMSSEEGSGECFDGLVVNSDRTEGDGEEHVARGGASDHPDDCVCGKAFEVSVCRKELRDQELLVGWSVDEGVDEQVNDGGGEVRLELDAEVTVPSTIT